MLYISTRNNIDSYTAYRALHEETAVDGGFFAPFRPLKPEQIPEWRGVSSGEAIAQVLNSFFGLSLTAWDVDCAIGRTPFQTVQIGRRSTVVECWHNPGSSWKYIVESLYACMCGKTPSGPTVRGWARVAIKTAMLFGLCAQANLGANDGFDLCIADDDFATVAAALYGKDLGLPVGKILCVCNENGALWDLLHRGEMSTTGQMYFEYLLHRAYGADKVCEYLDVCRRNGTFRLDEELLPRLRGEILTTVVSTDRIDSVISSTYRTNRYIADPLLAFTYGGLQDYRAASSLGNHTLLLGKESPVLSAQRLAKVLNLGKNELVKQINSFKE